MEGKINTHLFIMGLVTAILVSLITWLVFFNAFQNQVNADLKTDAQLIATSYDYITDDNNLKDFAKGQTRITLIKADGNVIFEGSGVEMSEKTVEYIKKNAAKYLVDVTKLF